MDELLIYQTEDGLIRFDVRMDGDTVWLSQEQMAFLFDSSKQNVGQHIRNILKEGELLDDSVVKKFFTTATDGKKYQINHYSLDVVIAVGYRVKSQRGTQFRIWATQRLTEYLTKGFTLDDKRLKEASYLDRYFDELTERIRDIRTSERQFYRKVADIYATSIDYDAKNDLTQSFYATVQNKFHFAITGKTADELSTLNNVVEQYLIFAEGQAKSRKAMRMQDWIDKLHGFLTLNDKSILKGAGKLSKEIADQHAALEYEKYRAARRLADEAQSDFDRLTSSMTTTK